MMNIATQIFFFALYFVSHAAAAQEILPKYFYVTENDKFGLIDEKGDVVIKPDFEFIQFYSAGNVFWAMKYLNYKVGNKYFLMHSDGRLVNNDTFDMAHTMTFVIQEWAFRKEEKWGALNEKGEVLIPFEYEKLYVHEPGMISAKRMGETGYFLAEQSYKFTPFPKQGKYDFQYIGDGYFSCYNRKKKRYGIFNAREDKFVLKAKYKEIKRVRYGQVLLSKFGEGIGVYDLNKRRFVVNMGRYIDIWMPSTHSAYVNKRAYLGGFDEDSLYIAKKKIDEDSMSYRIVTYLGEERKIGEGEQTDKWFFNAGSSDFFGGCAIFTVSGDQRVEGCVDKHGKIIIDPSMEYDWVGRCSEGLIPIGRNGKFGFVDLSGKEVIPLEFSEVSTFVNGLSQVEQIIDKESKKTKRGYIDRNGNWIWSTFE